MSTTLSDGRGWASDQAAASIHRMDEQLGRPVQITEAGRSIEDADANYRAWIAYQNGGPWAPRALPGSESVHCRGDAVDSNDTDAPWWANGWRETARSNDPDRDEPWHREYFPYLDQRINDSTPTKEEAPIMKPLMFQLDPRTDGRWVVVNVSAGTFYALASPVAQTAFLRATGTVQEVHGAQPPAVVAGMKETKP